MARHDTGDVTVDALLGNLDMAMKTLRDLLPLLPKAVQQYDTALANERGRVAMLQHELGQSRLALADTTAALRETRQELTQERDRADELERRLVEATHNLTPTLRRKNTQPGCGLPGLEGR